MVKKYCSYTLVEVMASMIIIMVISAAIAPILTKQKPRIEPIRMRGQYACWYKGSDLVEWYLDERTPRTKNPVKVSSCSFKPSEKAANYYIIAVGSDKDDKYAQVVTKYQNTLTNNLNITLGKNGGSTIIKYGTENYPLVIANGTAEFKSNGIAPSNLADCRLLETDGCPANKSKKPTGCKISQYNNSDNIEIKVELIGCETYDAYGNLQSYMMDVKDFVKKNEINSDTLTKAYIQNLAKSSNFYYVASNQQVNFKFKDSSWANDNINKIQGNKLLAFLESISLLRQSTLIQELQTANPGASKHNGAVLIIW